MALLQLLGSVSSAYWATGLLASVLFSFGLLRAIQDNKIRRLGAVRAPIVAGNPLMVLKAMFGLASANRNNRLIDEFNRILDGASPERRNCCEMIIGGQHRYILTREPEHIKAILTTKFAEFGKGDRFHYDFYAFLGDSIFTTDAKQWHDSRNLIRPMFVKDRVEDLAIFESRVSLMLSKLPADGVTVDIMRLFYRLTLDITTEFLLGTSVDSLENPKSSFARAFDDVQSTQMLISIMSPFQFIIPKQSYYRNISTLEEFIVPFIERVLALPPGEDEKPSKSDKRFTFLHQIARFTRDPKMIRDQIMAVLLAGRDTTAATLSWTLYELSARPDIVKRLRTEILSALGPTKAPTYHHLKNMPYLTHTISETLRLHPPVPFNVRTALVDTTIPGPPGQPDIAVLKGNAVTYSPLAMQRRRDLYPDVSPTFPDPDVFSPDRWDHWTPKPWQYLPFNGGPRICVGQNFAMTEMAYCLVRFLQRYERIEYRGDWGAQLLKADIVAQPAFGVPVAVHKATSTEDR